MDEQELKKVNKQLADLARARKYEADEAVKALIQHRQGRQYLWWLLEIGKQGAQPFTGNALTTSFNCGEFNVGQQILAHIIENAPEGYLTMLKEREDERRRANTIVGNSDGGEAGGVRYYDDGDEGRTYDD